MTRSFRGEGLQFARLLMVLSSLSPLFILWAIRGNPLIPCKYFILSCALLVIVPNLFLWRRISVSKRLGENRELVVGTAEDHRDHLLVYLFAMLLPVYALNLDNWRDFSAALVALIFMVLLFLHLNLHYMNPIFAIMGYRVFTVFPPEDENRFSGKESFVLITKRVHFTNEAKIIAYRLSNTVYFEVDK